MRRLIEWCWFRVRSRIVHLRPRNKGGYLAFVEKGDSAIPYGTLFLNPNAAAIMCDFRWREYRQLNSDVVFDAELQARRHFVYQGYAEGRLMDTERLRKLDASFYRNRHAELRLRNDWEARVHYSYAGYYEERIANSVDEWLCGATLHIFQPGKVGSHAISAAIDGKYPGGALHLHWPTDLALYFPWSTLAYPAIINRLRPQRLRVISAARDVVSYVLSGAFQYLSTVPAEGGKGLNAESVRTYLDASFEHNCRVLENWFDHQFYCGMDIYAHGFDHERGFVRVSNEVIELFIYRVESLSGLDVELGGFLGINEFQLQRINDAASKVYWKDYCDLFDHYVVPCSLLERLYSSRYMRHFFSGEERERQMERWSRPRIKSSH